MPGSTAAERSALMSQIGKVGARTKKINAVEKRIVDLVNSLPAPTEEQRRRLAALLLSDGAA